jgi:hypothetical protein
LPNQTKDFAQIDNLRALRMYAPHARPSCQDD